MTHILGKTCYFLYLFMYGMHNISQAPSEALKIQE